MQVTATVTV